MLWERRHRRIGDEADKAISDSAQRINNAARAILEQFEGRTEDAQT
jgi:hypothetical protein